VLVFEETMMWASLATRVLIRPGTAFIDVITLPSLILVVCVLHILAHTPRHTQLPWIQSCNTALLASLRLCSCI
jgi:hypothetical protein